MAPLAHELEHRLDRLRTEIGADAGDRLVLADEVGYFRLIDRAAADPDAEPLLRELGARFAACFVTPYLHAEDLRGVLEELAALLAIHHRARLNIESVDDQKARVTLRTLRAYHAAPTPFDLAVIDATLSHRFTQARLEPVPLGAMAETGPAHSTFDVRIDA